MTYFERTRRLAKEFFTFKKYKKMHPALAVLIGLLVSPFAIMFLFDLLDTFFMSILFSFFEAPIKYLHGILNDEAKKTRIATEVVIYIISWPLLFFFYVLYALTALFLVISYFFAVLSGYIASLGGFKFHISPFVEDIAIPEAANDQSKYSYTKRTLGYITVVVLLILVLGISAITMYSSLYANYQEEYFFLSFAPVLYAISSLYFLFTVIYIPIAYKNKEIEAK